MKAQKQSQEQREKNLLTYAKRALPGLKPEDDPFGDKELFDTETARYFAVARYEASVDTRARGTHRIVVKTWMFGWTHKHLHGVKYEEAKMFCKMKKAR